MELNLETLGQLPDGLGPTIDPRELTVGILHLGVGAFHRAHQAVYTEAAMAQDSATEWGICGVSERSCAVSQLLSQQDCLYSTVTVDAHASSVKVVGSLRKALFAQAQSEELLGAFADDAIKVVSLTVTEKGYRHNPSTMRLRQDDPEITMDLAGRPPVTVIGQLVRGLQARYAASGAPVSIVSCDNIPANSHALKALVEEFCSMLPADEADPLLCWIDNEVAFPSCMVDRIVAPASELHRDAAQAALGVRDRGVVACEPFKQWVIEDRFASKRPPWEHAGALMVDDVTPYETIKLRLLNGTHSSLAYLGALGGCTSIAEAVSLEPLAVYARRLMDEASASTVKVPCRFDFEAYKRSVLERFSNPALAHSTLQVAMDGTQKLPQRLLATIADLRAKGAEPLYTLLGVAAWMCFVWLAKDDKGRPLPLDDPLACTLRRATASARSARDVVQALLSLNEVFRPELTDDSWVADVLVDYVNRFTKSGSTVKELGHILSSL